MKTITVRAISSDDSDAVFELHKAAASVPGSGLARDPDEITFDYVRKFVEFVALEALYLGPSKAIDCSEKFMSHGLRHFNWPMSSAG